MRRAWLVLLVAGATAGHGLGQDKQKPPPDDPVARLLAPRVEEKLDLTPEQKEQVARLQKEFKQKYTELRDKTQKEVDKIKGPADKDGRELTRPERLKLNELARQLLKATQQLRGEYDPRLRAILTDEQKQRYDALRKEKPAAEKKANRVARRYGR